MGGDGVPASQKARKKMDAGEKLHVGQVRVWNNEQKFARVTCQDAFDYNGDDCYCHPTILQTCKAGPGDSIVFFLNWNGEKPQVYHPAIRIGAECMEEAELIQYALKGWYKGVADNEKGFGFISSSDIQALLSKDVYVTKDVAGECRAGWVSFNCN